MERYRNLEHELGGFALNESRRRKWAEMETDLKLAWSRGQGGGGAER